MEALLNLFKSKNFYAFYFLDYWRNKLVHLNHGLENAKEINSSSDYGFPSTTTARFQDYIHVEVHTTYYAIIETLFTLVYFLRDRNEKDIWNKIADSNNQTIKKVNELCQDLANNEFKTLDQLSKKGTNNENSLLEFIFFRGIQFHKKEKKDLSVNNVKKNTL